jgi:hypothetical protein
MPAEWRLTRQQIVQANYLDALNVSRVRIHSQKPKALGLRFGCGLSPMHLKKRGLLRPMQFLRAFVHWDHESQPTAPFFADVIHPCQSRQQFAVTSGLENDNE